MAKYGPKPRPPEERFWEKVNKTESCWLWLDWLNADRYGYFYVDGRRVRAHRFAYELLVGPIPEGLQLDHLCRVRHCVNPVHLEPVTGRENTRRGENPDRARELSRLRATKPYCKRGHPFTEESTLIGADGRRHCRACRRLRERAYREAKQ